MAAGEQSVQVAAKNGFEFGPGSRHHLAFALPAAQVLREELSF
jgi:hypothetical protein